MTDSIKNQCKRLYIKAFQDDEQFTDLLFEKFFDSSCRYLCENGIVISMLFAIDVTIDKVKGKYVYAVATDERYRKKGYMRKLFEQIFCEYKENYSFLCLKPMNQPLFDYYEKLGFEKGFRKSTVTVKNEYNECKLIPLTEIDEIKKVRKTILKEDYVEYCDAFYDLLLSYCDMYTDSIAAPTLFAVKETLSGKTKEVIGNYSFLGLEFSEKRLLIPGDDFDFAMIKFLNDMRFKNKYLGFALD